MDIVTVHVWNLPEILKRAKPHGEPIDEKTISFMLYYLIYTNIEESGIDRFSSDLFERIFCNETGTYEEGFEQDYEEGGDFIMFLNPDIK